MRPVVENWNIVVAGLWNTAIFSPHWTGKRLKSLFGIEQMNLEFVATARGTQVKFSTDRFTLIPGNEGLVVALKQIDDQSLDWAEKFVIDILGMLPHTPVSAFGVNFAFTEADLKSDLAALFRLSDSEQLAAHGYIPMSLSIQRSLRLEEARLNAILTYPEEGALSIRLNFHHDVAAAEEALERLRGHAVRYKKDGLSFLEKVYGLTMEEAQ
ncbi:MAG: hypothetical protein AB1733_02535 [Thermodesulfobacteriota bacterium]